MIYFQQFLGSRISLLVANDINIKNYSKYCDLVCQTISRTS